MSLWVFPSGDVHLVTGWTEPVKLRIVVLIPAGTAGTSLRYTDVWTDASTVNHMNVQFTQLTQDPGVAHRVTGFVGAHGGTAQPVTVSSSTTAGTSFHEVTAEIRDRPAPAPALQLDRGIVRISTHAQVTALFAGDRSLSTFADAPAGREDRVLTVYARFSDGTFEDVTGHPWLDYKSADDTIATVDKEGRIKGKAAGTTTVHVMTWSGWSPGFDVRLTVRPALSTGLGATLAVDELSRKTARQRTTLYVLAEGYHDRGRFFDRARQTTRALFGTKPYDRVSDGFHVVGVFQPSPDQGLTIGPRLVAAPRPAADERALWTGQPPGSTQPVPVDRLFTRDTLFGLMAGARLVSTPRMPAVPPGREAIQDPVQRFMAPRADIVEISPDDRRLPRFGQDTNGSFIPTPPNQAFADLIKAYLKAAGQTVGPQDRVAFLVDDEYYGGLRVEVLGLPLLNVFPMVNLVPMVSVSTGFSPTVHGVGGSSPVLDRAPVSGTFDDRAIGSIMAHELGHTYWLADEYEYEKTRRIYGPGVGTAEIDLHENIQHDSRLRRAGAKPPLSGDPTTTPPVPPSPPEVTRIKWNIPRIAKVSPVTAIAMVGPNNARLTVEAGQARRWTSGERAFMRNSLATPWNAAAGPRTVVIAVQISKPDPAGNTVDVGSLPPGFNPAILGNAPLLYVPKRNSSGVDLGLIDPIVLSFLAAHRPFPKPANTALWTSGAYYPPPIPGFEAPSPSAADAIGLYEGGGKFSHDIYRPAGRCKMRNPNSYDNDGKIVYDDFCFVCRYVLVELLDPSRHEGLDSEYPRDC